MVQRDFQGLGPHPTHYNIPTPTLGPFTHSKLSTSNIPTTIPSFSPGEPPSLLSTTPLMPPREVIVKVVGKSYPTPTDPPQLPTPPASRSNASFPANLMSPVTQGRGRESPSDEGAWGGCLELWSELIRKCAES